MICKLKNKSDRENKIRIAVFYRDGGKKIPQKRTNYTQIYS